MPALLILAVISWLLGSGKSRAKAGEATLFQALTVVGDSPFLRFDHDREYSRSSRAFK